MFRIFECCVPSSVDRRDHGIVSMLYRRVDLYTYVKRKVCQLLERRKKTRKLARPFTASSHYVGKKEKKGVNKLVCTGFRHFRFQNSKWAIMWCFF